MTPNRQYHCSPSHSRYAWAVKSASRALVRVRDKSLSKTALTARTGFILQTRLLLLSESGLWRPPSAADATSASRVLDVTGASSCIDSTGEFDAGDSAAAAIACVRSRFREGKHVPSSRCNHHASAGTHPTVRISPPLRPPRQYRTQWTKLGDSREQ